MIMILINSKTYTLIKMATRLFVEVSPVQNSNICYLFAKSWKLNAFFQLPVKFFLHRRTFGQNLANFQAFCIPNTQGKSIL